MVPYVYINNFMASSIFCGFWLVPFLTWNILEIFWDQQHSSVVLDIALHCSKQKPHDKFQMPHDDTDSNVVIKTGACI